MARCTRCNKRIRTLPDEEGQHPCPRCGYHPDPEPRCVCPRCMREWVASTHDEMRGCTECPECGVEVYAYGTP